MLSFETTSLNRYKVIMRLLAISLFPVSIPLLVAVGHPTVTKPMSSLPGVSADGGVVSGLLSFLWMILGGSLIWSVAMTAVSMVEDGAVAGTNQSVSTETPKPTTPEATAIDSPDQQESSPQEEEKQSTEGDDAVEYRQMISDFNETYEQKKISFRPPHMEFRGGNYSTKDGRLILNFSITGLSGPVIYDVAVFRSSYVYLFTYVEHQKMSPEVVEFNYFTNGSYKASAEVHTRWVDQLLYGNLSQRTPAPMDRETYKMAVLGTLDVSGEKVEMPELYRRCEHESNFPEECKNKLRDSPPVRYYLPERTATGGPYTSVMGAAQPNRTFEGRPDRLQYTLGQLRPQITGEASLEGYTPADPTDIWDEVEMNIRDIRLENETIVVEQTTRSEIGDDSLPLRQVDIIGAKYGRIIVNNGARFMPANGVRIVQYTPDGRRYATRRIPNHLAVKYINGGTSIVGFINTEGTLYQDPGQG